MFLGPLPARRPALTSALLGVATTAFAMTAGPAPAQTAVAPRAADEQAIRAATTAYREALEKGDAAALAGLWTPDGDIVDDAGNVLPGRDTAALIGDTGDGPRPEFRIVDTSLRFLCGDAAIEDGTVEVRLPGGGTLEGHFSAVWVKHEGAWKLAAIREARSPEGSSSAVLEQLDWMVGDWRAVSVSDATGGTAATPPNGTPITMSVRWNPTRTFLSREMVIPPPAGAPAELAPLAVSQQIGWDPLARQVRGWAFGSDGSHGESTWMLEDGAWVSRTMSIRPDGRKTSSLIVYAPDGPNRLTVQSLPTHVGGEHEPHVVMTFERTPAR